MLSVYMLHKYQESVKCWALHVFSTSAALTRSWGGNTWWKGESLWLLQTISDLALQSEWENRVFRHLLAALCASSLGDTFRRCCRWSAYSKRLLVGLQDANMAAKCSLARVKDVEVSKGTELRSLTW